MTVFQIAALVYLVLYCGLLIGFRTYLLYKSTELNALKHRKKSGKYGIVDNIFKFCLFLIFVVVLNFVFIENNYKYLVPITLLEKKLLASVGIFLSLSGLFLGFIAQLQMGDSWRLAPNDSETTSLITHSAYKYSRNPIYLGYMISIVGFFLLMPNVLSLVVLVLTFCAIHVKIRLEEQHLISKNGKEYQEYLKRVRRWL